LKRIVAVHCIVDIYFYIYLYLVIYIAIFYRLVTHVDQSDRHNRILTRITMAAALERAEEVAHIENDENEELNTSATAFPIEQLQVRFLLSQTRSSQSESSSQPPTVVSVAGSGNCCC
jgi:hypothetical protein